MTRRRPSSRFRDFDEIDLLFGGANPNPLRIGCLTDATLMALGLRRRPIGDPGYRHLTECSSCYASCRSLQRAHRRGATEITAEAGSSPRSSSSRRWRVVVPRKRQA